MGLLFCFIFIVIEEGESGDCNINFFLGIFNLVFIATINVNNDISGL